MPGFEPATSLPIIDEDDDEDDHRARVNANNPGQKVEATNGVPPDQKVDDKKEDHDEEEIYEWEYYYEDAEVKPQPDLKKPASNVRLIDFFECCKNAKTYFMTFSRNLGIDLML